MTKDTGGPAFPIWQEGMNLGDTAGPGMTLRDWFAGQALQGLLRSRGKEIMAGPTAADAYFAADAMIAERSKP